jgi:ribonuclease R
MSKNKKKHNKLKEQNNVTYTGIYYKNKNGMGGVCKVNDLNIIIKEDKENFALDHDEITVSSYFDKTEKLFGNIIEIKKHNTTNLIGKIIKNKEKFYFQVLNSKFGNYVVIPSNVPTEYNDELYNAIIKEYPSSNSPNFKVEIINSIGKIGDLDTFIKQLVIEANLPYEFSEKAILDAKKYKDKILVKDLKKRKDLRELNFVTIDGEDAKDFDDAVYCEKYQDNYILYVAIADVAHYVKHESSLDIEAYQRGNSVYFPKYVIPMLPEYLSNGLCSLNPNVDRLVMCARMEIDQKGKLIKSEIFNAIINSKARLTYNIVQEYLDTGKKIEKDLKPYINNLYEVFQALLKSRDMRGAIDFESEEPYFIFNDENIVTEIKPRNRLNAHRLIEECMLIANVTVAEFINDHKHDILYRVHEKPSEAKFNNLKAYLNSLAIDLNVSYETLTPHDYANLLKSVKENKQFNAIQLTALRSLQLAMYSPNNIGHFGLNYIKYLHFTSPIRRYSDLLTHRVLKKILDKESYQFAYPIETIGESVSFTERRAEDLERKVDAFLKCQYAKGHIGKIFKGVITSIVNFGVFVYISELMVDGLLHVAELGEDYFIFDEKSQLLFGKKTGISYKNGQILDIEILNVDMEKCFIDFGIVGKEENNKNSKKKRKT